MYLSKAVIDNSSTAYRQSIDKNPVAQTKKEKDENRISFVKDREVKEKLLERFDNQMQV